MSNSDILDLDMVKNPNSDCIDIELVNSTKFIVLAITTLGLYVIWWMYKSWKFLKEKDNLDIMPIPRAIFGIIFFYSLADQIQKYAHSFEYKKSYDTTLLFLGFLVLNLLARLPDPYWLISFFAFVFVIQPLNAFNYAVEKSELHNAVFRKNFTVGQIVLVVLGLLFISLVIIGLNVSAEEF